MKTKEQIETMVRKNDLRGAISALTEIAFQETVEPVEAPKKAAPKKTAKKKPVKRTAKKK